MPWVVSFVVASISETVIGNFFKLSKYLELNNIEGIVAVNCRYAVLTT